MRVAERIASPSRIAPNRRLYRKRLVGAILLGEATLSATLKKLIENQTSCVDMLKQAYDAEAIHAALAAIDPKT